MPISLRERAHRVTPKVSVCLRTLPKTRNPRSSSSFAAAQPMPVDAPVITTDFMMGNAPVVMRGSFNLIEEKRNAP